MSDNTIKMSIILPIYNMEKHLECSVGSLLKQTLKDIEIICIDDCSKDNTLEILENMAKEDSRVVVVKQETNQGSGAARNLGISLAKGEYIYFLDPDDWVEPDLCEITYENAKKHDADLVVFDYETIFVQTNKTRRHNVAKNVIAKGLNITPFVPYNYKEHKELTLCESKNISWIRIYKKSFVIENNLKFSTTKRGQDKVFSIDAKLCAERIIYINKVLHHWQNWREEQFVKNIDHWRSMQEISSIVYKHNPDEKMIQELNECIRTATFRQYIGLPSQDKKILLDKAKNMLSYNAYKKLEKRIIQHKIRNLFSIRNVYINDKKHKMITIFGKEFQL